MPFPASLIALFACCLSVPLLALADVLSASDSLRFVQSLDVPKARMLLVADETMRDPRFRQTVVLIVEHSRLAGTLGLIINRRADTDLGALVPEFTALGGIERAIFTWGDRLPVAGWCIWPAQRTRRGW